MRIERRKERCACKQMPPRHGSVMSPRRGHAASGEKLKVRVYNGEREAAFTPKCLSLVLSRSGFCTSIVSASMKAT